ncbi:MAG: D-sedoheptulose-7-phosphate isomerase [Vicinamibacterales bacterium]
MARAKVADRLRLAAAAHERAAANGTDAIVVAGEAMRAALAAGKSILAFGNGGSAADAQHFVAELVVRYERERPGRSAIALTTDSSILTAAANDTGYEQVFARQIDAIGRTGDIALAISTSGTSSSVVRALGAANARGMVTIALTGRDGGDAGKLASIHVNVPETRTAVVQEVHTTILHVWCELIDEGLGEA